MFQVRIERFGTDADARSIALREGGVAMNPTSQNRPKRWSARRKTKIVLRLLRGERPETLSREAGQPPSTLLLWRDEFLEGGTQMLKRRNEDGQLKALEHERQRLQAKIGELTMVNEELVEKIDRMNGNPAGSRRSK